MKNLVGNKYLIIQSNEASNTLSVTWKGVDVSDAEYRQILKGLLSLIPKKEFTALHLDLSKLNQYIAPENQAWTLKEWIPNLRKLSIKNLRVDIPRKTLGQISIKSIYGDLTNDGLQIHFLNSN